MHQHFKCENRIYFSRWSRKNYSLFSCLGKEIVISTLKYKLADAGMKTKRGSFFLRLLNFTEQEEEEKDTSERADHFLQENLIPCIVSSLQHVPAATSADFYKKI